jgi:hypothetical protein
MTDPPPDLRATRWETVGAWLHLWTPRRGTTVPPAPWRTIAIVGGLVVVAAAVGIVVATRSAEKASKREAAVEHVKLSAAARRERARLKIEQVPHYGHAVARPPSPAAQAALVGALESSITADAQARFRAGKLDTQTRDTVCTPFVRPSVPHPPQPPVNSRAAGYECVAVTARVGRTQRTKAVIVGFPFWARVDFVSGRYHWCKINPRPAEHGTYSELAFVPPVPACNLLKK